MIYNPAIPKRNRLKLVPEFELGDNLRGARQRAVEYSGVRGQSNEYIAFLDNPIARVDPLGLQTSPAPTASPTLEHSGSGTWGEGRNKVTYDWSVTDTSAMADLNKQIGTAPPGVFKLIKVKRGKDCNCDSLHWIQYTGAYQDGKPYTPPGGKFPWVGIDVGGRDDGSPYTDTPEEQGKIDTGTGTGWRGVVKGLYNPTGFNSIFIDWASSGGAANWKHVSVAVLVCSHAGKDTVIGSLKFVYTTGADGKLSGYGATGTAPDDIKAWEDALKLQNGDYFKNVYGGGAK